MFFKELACLYCLVINVHFGWNVLLSNTLAFRSRVSLINLSYLFAVVNNFFQTFLIYFHSFKEVLKTNLFA